MTLSPIQIVNGIFSLIFVIISVIVSILFLSKYRRYKSKLILLFGIVLLLLVSSWYASSSSFLIALFINGTGYITTPQIYFVIGFVPLPIAAYIWSIVLTELVFQEKKKIFTSAFIIMGIIMEIVFFVLLGINPILIGQVISPIDADYTLLFTLYEFFLVIYMLITGILFGMASLREDNPEIRLKGKLLIMAFVSFFIGAILEILSEISIVIMIIARLILISSSIEFYGGFMLPDWMKKLFKKNK